jgi:phosphoglycerate dehydrogenase-like enzyme
VRSGGWLESVRPDRLRRLTDLTVGVVGLGRIGQRVARAFAAGFGCRVVGWSPTSTAEGVEAAASLADLLAVSDLLTVHVPLVPATRGLIGAGELSRMPAGGYVVNTSRGGVVDEAALVAALRSGHLAGAGLDVFGTEPPPADGPLRSLPNVVLSPHVGYLSGPSLLQARRHTIEDVIAVLDRRPPVHTLLPP